MYTINPWLIGAFIFCATAIAIVAICCDYRVEKKSIEANKVDNSNECRLSKKIIKIHRNYIAGFLGFAIIMLLTAQFGRSYRYIFEYLSFASTITSLVLSILAIFVTVHSSSDLYKQFTRIDSATDVIKSASREINGILNAIQKADSNLRQTSNQISGQLSTSNEISDKLDDVSIRIFQRIDQNEKMMTDLVTENYSNSSSKVDNNKNNIDIKEFLIDTSRFGLYTLFACALSKEKEKPFDLSDIFADHMDKMYALGYIVGLRSTGLLQFMDRENDDDLFVCVKSEFKKEEIVNQIRDRFDGSINKRMRERNLKIINTICDFFQEDRLVL